jgi:hypothetical protein
MGDRAVHFRDSRTGEVRDGTRLRSIFERGVASLYTTADVFLVLQPHLVIDEAALSLVVAAAGACLVAASPA